MSRLQLIPRAVRLRAALPCLAITCLLVGCEGQQSHGDTDTHDAVVDTHQADTLQDHDANPTDTRALDTAASDARSDQSTTTTWYHPPVNATWQWQLTGTINQGYDVDVYDIDLFDSDVALIQSLQSAGRAVVCYFSAGSSEDWRPDHGDFLASDLGNPLDGWAGENWLDIRSATVRSVMEARLDLAAAKGCDGVEPDNVEGYANDPGFPLTAADQLAYNRWLATRAHARGLAIGLKNDLDQIDALVGDFDFAVNEECHQWDECAMLTPFIAAGKPVFSAEYADDLASAHALASQLCDASSALGLQTLVLPLDLDDSFRVACAP